MKQFLYVEQTDGGMNECIVSDAQELSGLYGWMHESCAKEDTQLANWMDTAEIGDHADHRLGIIVRLKDGQQ